MNETTNLQGVTNRILDIAYRGGKTNTPAGLRLAVNAVLLEQSGDRSNVKDIIVLITDGMTSPEYVGTLARSIQTVRDSGATVFGKALLSLHYVCKDHPRDQQNVILIPYI